MQRRQRRHLGQHFKPCAKLAATHYIITGSRTGRSSPVLENLPLSRFVANHCLFNVCEHAVKQLTFSKTLARNGPRRHLLRTNREAICFGGPRRHLLRETREAIAKNIAGNDPRRHVLRANRRNPRRHLLESDPRRHLLRTAREDTCLEGGREDTCCGDPRRHLL